MKSAKYLFVIAVVMATELFPNIDYQWKMMTNAALVDFVTPFQGARAFRIKPKPCWDKNRTEGICMFQWECHRRNGQMLTTCIDRFLFGTCCQLASNITLDETNNTSTVTPTRSDPATISTTTSTENANVWGEPGFIFTPEPPAASSAAVPPPIALPTPNIDHIFQQFLGTVLSNYSNNIENVVESVTEVTSSTSTESFTVTTVQVTTSQVADYDGEYNYDDMEETTKRDTTILANVTTNTTPILISNTTSVSISVVETQMTDSPLTSSAVSTTTIPTNELEMDLNVYDDVYSDVDIDEPLPTTAIPTTTTTTSATTTTTKRPYDYKKDCGIRPLLPNGRIVGGTNSRFGEWPWQVLIKEATWLGLFVKNKCGGVLLNHKYVITAAHCQPSFLASLLVIFGESDLAISNEELKPTQRNVRRVVVHRKFNALTFDNDLALLEMDRAVEYKPHIVPICLPNAELDLTDQVAAVSGWGRLKYGGRLPTALQHVEVPIIPNRKCQQMFLTAGHIKGLGDKFICAGYADGQKDSCEGDSGGPLMLEGDDGRWILIGTVSHGIKCAYPNLPGVYINIAAYKNWILKVINS